MASPAHTSIDLPGLKRIAQGKVRDLYELPENGTLLFVTTDRISAYDCILKTGIASKGAVLTLLSAYWFAELSNRVPGLKHHFLHLGPPPGLDAVTQAQASLLLGRCMTVKRLKVFAIEVIVRGYITGSAWAEYEKSQTIHGISAPAGLQRCQRLPEPMYTPSTKADIGEHDLNISPEEAARTVGDKYAAKIEKLALDCYKAGAAYAEERGIIIADTKFEFALDEATDEVFLVDEVLTPDSSRFWSKADYKVGQEQRSFDKQDLRDWLTENGLKGKQGVELPADVAEKTSQRYLEAYQRLTGTDFSEAMSKLKP
jgi:phosphoribosylaminoimidazole-succinocarboxamide synthase